MMKRLVLALALSGGAISAATAQSSVFQQNQVLAGPTSGSGHSAPRLLVGGDLPNPGASSLGGVRSATCSSSNWFNSLSTSGVLGCTQPAFSDLTGSVAASQMPALTGDCTTSAGAVATTCLKTNGVSFGTAATQNTGTSGATIPLNNGNNTFSGNDTLSGTNIYSGTGTFTGDALFKSGRPWADVRAWGAVGDSSTDDTTAIQNAINFMQSTYGGGIVFFPPSNGRYCTFTGITVTSASIWLLSNGEQTSISACNHDVSVVTLSSANYSKISNLIILGRGAVTTDTFAFTKPALAITNGVGVVVEHSQILGGTSPISINGGGDWILQDIYASEGYGGAVVYVKNSGGWLKRAKIDQAWPGTVPCCGNKTFPAWASGTAYTANTSIVTSGGYYLQATVSGTSGGVAPTLKPYGANITDNTVTWRLVGSTAYYGIQCDTGCFQLNGEQVDLNGSYTAGLAMTNTLAGTVPGLVTITNSAFGQIIDHSVYAHDGYGLYLSGNTMGSCATTNCQGVYLNTNWSDTFEMVNSIIYNGSYGVLVAAGSNATMSNNSFTGNNVAGVLVTTGSTHTIVSGNLCGTSSNFGGVNAIGIQTSGTADYYALVNNICHGATSGVQDSATGTHKTVSGNL